MNRKWIKINEIVQSKVIPFSKLNKIQFINTTLKTYYKHKIFDFRMHTYDLEKKLFTIYYMKW